MPEVLEQLSSGTGLRIASIFAVPEAMTEPSDMDIVQSTCHLYEPIKVPAGHEQPIHCLVADPPSLSNSEGAGSLSGLQDGDRLQLTLSSRIHCGYDIQY